MTKFKVGDIIRANEKSNDTYLVTNQKHGWTGKVLNTHEDGDIYVKTLTPKANKGDKFVINEKYCDFLNEVAIAEHIITPEAVIIKLDDGRKGIAKCNPTDKFNLAFGTALAVARAYGDKETEAKLLAEPAEPVKEKPKFKVGELVRIRQWDDMEKEFGTNHLGTILTQEGFLGKMEPLCGKYAEITRLDKDNRVFLKFFNCEWSTIGWDYSTDMIEKV